MQLPGKGGEIKNLVIDREDRIIPSKRMVEDVVRVPRS